ncbi:MAG: sulfide/dihydroorotate dehydrogenase-like FAD/NAD-binding protein [Thermoplasmata archaeon]|nr:sulfide/dihydroorotate dehydrogenase-like FAD/NAD-binding protein [Thermoplasmata archaeon]
MHEHGKHGCSCSKEPLWPECKFQIVRKERLAQNIDLWEVTAPLIAERAKAGQFVMVRIHDKGERIPLTLADWDRGKGTITLVFMQVGKTTRQMGLLKAGDCVPDLIGPLGTPTHAEKFGTVVCVAGGVGVAPAYPVARAMKNAGNKVITVMGARTKDLLFWEDKVRTVSDEVIVTTDDGSYRRKGVVTEPLKEVLQREKVDLVFAVGPAIMMKFCALTTKPFNVKTVASLNPIMVDGTGMCGCCRVTVGTETKFACVHGPDFDAHLVDWDEFMARQRVYLEEEKLSLQLWENRLKGVQ